MPTLVTVKPAPIDEKLKDSVSSIESFSDEDRVDTIKQKYKLAKDLLPNYEELKKELSRYNVDLPTEFTMHDLSKVNKLYSIAQEYCSRVATVEHIAIDNHSRWERTHKLMNGYLIDCESKLFVTKEVMDLPNTKIQQSFVRNKLNKLYNTIEKIFDYMQEAEAFKRIIEVKKKDLVSVLNNLTRQVKVLKTEQELMH